MNFRDKLQSIYLDWLKKQKDISAEVRYEYYLEPLHFVNQVPSLSESQKNWLLKFADVYLKMQLKEIEGRKK